VPKKPPLPSTEKLRSISSGNAVIKASVQKKRERSPNLTRIGMTRREREQLEKELQTEMQEKLKKIDDRMEKKKKCNK